MSSDSPRYLNSKSQSIVTNWKLVVIFGIVFLMLLPYAFSAPARSLPQQNSQQLPPNLSPTVSSDFTLTANPTSITTSAGSTQTVTITITSTGGFVGTVYMEASSFSFPTSLPVSLNPPIVTLTSGGSTTSTLTITIPSNALPSDNTIFIQATGGCTLFHLLDVPVTITGPDFTITSDKTHITLPPGGSDSANILLASLNGFSGFISLNSFSPFTTSLTPTSATLTPGGTASSVFSITAPITIQPGNYTLSVDGFYTTGGFISHSTSIVIIVPGPALALAADRHFLTLVAGGASNTTTITATGSGGLTGQVALGATPATPLSPSLTPASVAVNGSSVLTVIAPLGTKAQSYFIDVDGTAGPVHASTVIVVSVKAPDFEISANPFFMAVVAAGSSCSSTITVASILGFNANVGLVLKAPSTLTASLDVVNVPGGSGASTLTVSAPTGTVPGFYTVDVNGTSSSPALTHTAFVDILVIGPDYSVSASPDPVTVVAGSSGTSTIILNPILGFSDAVNLVASSFDPQLTVSVSPASVTPGTPATLTITPAPGTVPGSFYSVQVNATSGQITHSIYISITVTGPGFYLTANPPALTVNAGPTPQTSTITVTPTNGFNSPVNLFASPDSANLNASIVPSTVTSGSYTVTLSVNSTIPGSYKVDIFGSSGLVSNDTSVTVTVVGPDFSISDNPSSLTITAGGSQTSTVTINPVGGFNSAVALTANAPPGITATFSPTSITAPTTSTLTIAVDPSVTPGAYTVDIHGASGSIDRVTLLTVNVAGFNLAASPGILAIDQGATQTSTVTVTAQNGFTGTVALTTSTLVDLTASLSPTSTSGSGTSTLTITASNTINPGSYTITVTGTSGLLTQTATVTITVPPPDFSLSANPTTLSVNAGAAATATIAAAQVNGLLTGTVSLTSNVSPAGMTCTLSSMSIPLGTSQTSTLSCYSPTAATYTVTVTGTSGSLTHTATVTFTVQDFTIAASSATVTTTVGSAGTSTITVTAVNGFAGVVSLASTSSPAAGITCTLTPTSVTGPGTSTLSCTPSGSGTFTVSVTGTNGALSHTATVTYSVSLAPDFSLTPASTTITIPANSIVSENLRVDSLNGFTATVTFSGPVSVFGGVNVFCSSVTLTSTMTSGTSVCDFSSSTLGTFSTVVNGTSVSPAVFHLVTYTVNVIKATLSISTSLSASTITAGDSVTDSAILHGADTLTPTGTVTYEYFAGPSCTGTATAVGTPVVVNSGVIPASQSHTFTSAGSFSWNAIYSGDALNNGATSPCEQLTVNAPFDYTIIASPTSSSISAGSTFTATITARLTSGVAVPVTLRVSNSPNPSVCIPASGQTSPCGTFLFSPASITPTSAGATSTFTISTTNIVPPDTYTLTITGTPAGASSTSATITLTITAAPTPDLTISATTTPISATTNSPATSTITVSAVHGFTSAVTLSISAPSGITCTLDHTTLQGSGTATLTCNSNTPNDYSVTVTATGGATPHTTTQTFHFSAPASPVAPAPSILGLSPVIFYGLIGVIIAIAIAGIVVVIRRKKP